MGYITSYELDTRGEATPAEIYAIIERMRGANSDFCYPLDSDLEAGEDCTWYDAEDDIMALSRAFPNNTFVLSGVGEERFDFWKREIHRGRSMNVDPVWVHARPEPTLASRCAAVLAAHPHRIDFSRLNTDVMDMVLDAIARHRLPQITTRL